MTGAIYRINELLTRCRAVRVSPLRVQHLCGRARVSIRKSHVNNIRSPHDPAISSGFFQRAPGKKSSAKFPQTRETRYTNTSWRWRLAEFSPASFDKLFVKSRVTLHNLHNAFPHACGRLHSLLAAVINGVAFNEPQNSPVAARLPGIFHFPQLELQRTI